MEVDKPVGNTLFAPMMVRVALGCYLLAAGWMKSRHLEIAVEEVVGLGMFPSHFATLFGILLPYLELAAGAMLVLGLWTTLAGLLSSVIFVVYIYILGLFPIQTYLLNKDVILLFVAISVMYSGAGAYSVDRFRASAAK